MGSDASYHEAGKHHPDTTAYKDEDVLAAHGYNPDKLTTIRIFWSEYCVGFEAFYDGVSAGARLGSEFVQGTVYSEMHFAPDEHITKITGRAGDLIDQISFHTNKGNSQTFGSSSGGHAFTLNEHGKVVKSFTVGFGGHLHFIGAHWGYQIDPPVKSAVAGKTHGDTQHFDDFSVGLDGKHCLRLAEIRVLHDNNMIFGVEGIYEANGVQWSPGVHVGSEMSSSTINQSIALPAGTYITEISGRHGDVMDHLTIKLNNGTKYDFGGSGGNKFGNIVSSGKKVIALGGGLGGHMHNIFCYAQ